LLLQVQGMEMDFIILTHAQCNQCRLRYGRRQHKTHIIVRMLADQVNSAGGTGYQRRRTVKFPVCLRNYLYKSWGHESS
jgi:hypothetical protein